MFSSAIASTFDYWFFALYSKAKLKGNTVQIGNSPAAVILKQLQINKLMPLQKLREGVFEVR